MSETDFDHISKLFTVIDGCVNHSGKFAAIQNEAFTALAKANDELRKKQLQKKEADERALAEHQHRQATLKAEEADKEAAERKAQEEQVEKDRPRARSIPAQNLENSAANHEAQANATKVEREREERKAEEHSNLGLASEPNKEATPGVTPQPEPNQQLDLSGKPIEPEATNGNPNVGGDPAPIDRRI